MDNHLNQNASLPLTHTFTSSNCHTIEYNPFSVLYLFMFPLALLLNSMAAWVSIHLKSTTTFIVYLKNLIGADLILTLSLPAIAVSGLPNASHRIFVLSCRFFSAIFYSALYTSITFLGLISLDRFTKIVTPQNKFSQSVILTSVVSVAVWMIVFVFPTLSTMILSSKDGNETVIETCMDTKVTAGILLHTYLTISLNVYFWIVSVIVAICYICITNKVIQSFRNSGSNNSKGKQKIKLRVFLVLVVFFVSFGPYHIIRIPYTFEQVNSENSCSHWWLIKEFGLWLATNNICLDPLLYVFLCREFSEKLLSLLSNIPCLYNIFRRIFPDTTGE